jgi:hypothetical protein
MTPKYALKIETASYTISEEHPVLQQARREVMEE